jgi:hypothetical protein
LVLNRLYILSDFILVSPGKDHYGRVVGGTVGGGCSTIYQQAGAILLLMQEILLIWKLYNII